LSDIRCPKCNCKLAEYEFGRVEIKRSQLEIRAYGVTMVAAKCPRCGENTERVLD
jgi:phage FluMu protein Com